MTSIARSKWILISSVMVTGKENDDTCSRRVVKLKKETDVGGDDPDLYITTRIEDEPPILAYASEPFTENSDTQLQMSVFHRS